MQKARETLENLQQVSLEDEGHLLRVLIDNIPDYIYIKDTRSKFVLANQKLARDHHLGSPKDILGKSDHDFYPKELADKYYRDEQEIIKTGRAMINQEDSSLASGQIKQVEFAKKGREVEWRRVITDGTGQVLADEVLKSDYSPWPAYYLVGPGTQVPLGVDVRPTDETAES